jgi:hypothetical protein
MCSVRGAVISTNNGMGSMLCLENEEIGYFLKNQNRYPRGEFIYYLCDCHPDTVT